MKYFCGVILVLISIYKNEAVLGESIHENLKEFSVDMYRELIGELKGNFVYSPYSIANVLALTSLGSRGQTETEIKSALKINVTNEKIEENFKEVAKLFKDSEKITIETANKLYLAEGFVIEPEFSKIAVDIFNAGVENVDFKEPKKAAEEINSWVEKQTHNKILNVVDEKKLSDITRLVLVSSLYFSGNWAHPFKKEATEKKNFHNSKAVTVEVDMMKMSANLYLDHDTSVGASILSLPYQNTDAELVIVLPDEIEGLEAIEKNTQKLWENRNFTSTQVNVFLPKFKVESSMDMIPILKKLGITNLFKEADLSGITKEPLVVTSITQKTFIDVNEMGTEAASTSFVVADNRKVIIPNQNGQVFNVDRPFMFALMYDGIEILSGRVEKF